MTRIVPTIGRIMWYWPEKERRGTLPLAFIVCNVHGEDMVSGCAFDTSGIPVSRTSVPIVQEGSPYSIGDSPYLAWMPYQQGQAKKAESSAG